MNVSPNWMDGFKPPLWVKFKLRWIVGMDRQNLSFNDKKGSTQVSHGRHQHHRDEAACDES